MRLQLTEKEQQDLIFQEGDYYEVISGSFSLSFKNVIPKSPKNPLGRTDIKFFFECTDPAWGTKEWPFSPGGDIPNGPALLVLYRRERTACVFGVISMVNRAWTHAMPILTIDLINESARMTELRKLETAGLVTTIGGALGAGVLSMFTGGLGRKKMAQSVANQSQKPGSYQDIAAGITAMTRSLLFRIANNADQYWEGGGVNASGKL